MKLIKETNRPIYSFKDYVGVCDGCQIELEYPEELVLIEVGRTDEMVLLVPKDTLICPNCSLQIGTLKLYKLLDVTEEFKSVRIKNKSDEK